MRIQNRLRSLTALVVTAGALVAAPHASTAASASSARTPIAATFLSSFVVRADGTPTATGIRVWGPSSSDSARLTSLTPLRGLPRGVRAKDIQARLMNTIVLGSDGQVYGAGNNNFMQIGGTTPSRDLRKIPGLPKGVRATQVAIGENTAYALGSNRKVYAVGHNGVGQMGIFPSGELYHPAFIEVPALPDGKTPRAIAAGDMFLLVLDTEGQVYGTGHNYSGQLGDFDGASFLYGFRAIPGAHDVVAISAGASHSLFLTEDGRVYGSGSNESGQLSGSDSTYRYLIPLIGMPSSKRVAKVVAGPGGSVVVTTDKRIFGTGESSEGQLGVASDVSLLTEIAPSLLAGKVADAAMGTAHSLISTIDGTVYGLGDRAYGQLGSNSSDGTATPVKIGGQVITPVAPPTIRGTAHVGRTVRVTAPQWLPTPNTLRYQWQRGGKNIAGATGTSYRLRKADRGKRITVRITPAAPGLVSQPVITARVKALGAPPRLKSGPKPKITGSLKVGSRLKISNLSKKSWKPRASKLSYQWLRNGKPISRATKSTYQVRSADKRKKLSVRITARKSTYAPATFTTRPKF